MMFPDTEMETIRAALLADTGSDLIEYMYRRERGQSTESLSPGCRNQAMELGWIDDGDALTPHGYCVSDSCREYRFWTERDRALPFEGAAPALSLDGFAGMSVIEIGCGMGANLMSLQKVTDRLVGIEPCGVYIQMGQLLREKDGLPALRIESCPAERITMPDGEFDIALCVSSHQYLDIAAAFSEIARILKPGGKIMLIGGTFSTYFLSLSVSEGLKADLITLANTVSYMAARKRVVPARQGTFTGRPIYPPISSLRRWLHQVGFTPDQGPYPRFGTERFLQAEKTA